MRVPALIKMGWWQPGLWPAQLVDQQGEPVSRAMVPSGARVVTALGRVFLHYDKRVWREVPTAAAVLVPADTGADA